MIIYSYMYVAVTVLNRHNNNYKINYDASHLVFCFLAL